MEERHIRVQRTARYHVLGEPATARSVWIVVHGYGQLARFFLNAFEEQSDEKLIVAPEGLSRFYTDASHQRVGATWMTREDREHEISDHVAYLDAVCDVIRKETGDLPLHALGFSQGVATVVRWMALGTNKPERVILWGGSLPPDLTGEELKRTFQQSTVQLVHGSKDDLVPEQVWRENAERLSRANVKAQAHSFPGGHAIDPVILGRCMEQAG